MKYKINDTISINNVDWTIAEYRMHGGREYRYTLSHESTDGSYTTMSLNERAMDGLILSGAIMGSKNEISK